MLKMPILLKKINQQVFLLHQLIRNYYDAIAKLVFHHVMQKKVRNINNKIMIMIRFVAVTIMIMMMMTISRQVALYVHYKINRNPNRFTRTSSKQHYYKHKIKNRLTADHVILTIIISRQKKSVIFNSVITLTKCSTNRKRIVICNNRPQKVHQTIK